MPTKSLNVGIVGAGIGGLTAAIAIADAGAQVTVLEATSELGEIGAGIQMSANVSRFLVRTGVDEIIGDDLVQVDEVRTWGHKPDYPLIGRLDVKRMIKHQGFPWWVVRRDHLHAGLAEGARRRGVKLVVGFRVVQVLQHGKGKGAGVISERGDRYDFDLILGCDGIKSAMRGFVFPGLKPHAASNIAAFRSVIPYEEVFRKIPEARMKLGNTMDAWVGPGGYILLYPLTAGKELNVVTAYQQSRPITQLEDVSVEEFRAQYQDWDPFICKILDMVTETKKWPLLVIPPTKSWSDEDKNIVLTGDAAHGMQNHMAQGAATAMEDGIFLGRVLSEFLRGIISLEIAIELYEKKRMPRAFHKQQSAFTQGELLCVKDDERLLRDHVTLPEIQAWDQCPTQPTKLPSTYRSWLLFSSLATVPSILNYDAESDADFAVDEYLFGRGDIDSKTLVSRSLRAKWWSSLKDNGVDEAWTSSSGSKL